LFVIPFSVMTPCSFRSCRCAASQFNIAIESSQPIQQE